jgi:dTDP-4-dehydrorhamnose reductase
MKSKILLFGSSGMLGTYINSYFKKMTNIEVIKAEFRITRENLDNLESCMLKYDIDHNYCIINCIGLIPQRKDNFCSNIDYFLVNGLFPHMLWKICKQYNCKMIQPTTDCVFSGKKGNYNENDYHDEENFYGLSKSLGEPLEATIIRTSIIGCELYNKKSFLEWVISNNFKTINGYENHLWNGITCLEYCKLINFIIQNDMFWKGVRHFYSPNFVNKYQMAKIIAESFNLDIEIKSQKSEVVDKTLSSIYPNFFEIAELKTQINELSTFTLT